VIDYALARVPADMPVTGIIWCLRKLKTVEYRRFHPLSIDLPANGSIRQQIGIQSLRFNKGWSVK
jgi:hypothetical protein